MGPGGLQRNPFARRRAAERAAGGWAKELLGLPSDASVAFVTGAQAANTVGIAVGRNEVLARVEWDVARDGPLAAMCERVTIAEVEELVEPGELDPNDIHTPGVYVQRVVALTPEQAAAAKAKYWTSEMQNEMPDPCVQLHRGYGRRNWLPLMISQNTSSLTPPKRT